MFGIYGATRARLNLAKEKLTNKKGIKKINVTTLSHTCIRKT